MGEESGDGNYTEYDSSDHEPEIIPYYRLTAAWIFLAVAGVAFAFDLWMGKKLINTLALKLTGIDRSTLDDDSEAEEAEAGKADQAVVDAKEGMPAVDEDEEPLSAADLRHENSSIKEKLGFLVFAICLPAMGELYYGVIVPFFPGEAHVHGVEESWVGVILACHAVGVMAGCYVSPLLLRVLSPATVLRQTLIYQAAAASIEALTGGIPGSAGWAFGIVFALARTLFGVATGLNEVTAQSIVFRSIKKDMVGPVMGLFMALRTVATLVSPMIGSWLYDAGGFELPFTAGAGFFIIFAWPMLIFLDAITPVTPGKLETMKSIEQVMRVPRMWVVLMIPFGTRMWLYSLEGVWEGELKMRPYDLSISQIGYQVSVMPGAMAFGMFAIGGWMYFYIGANLQQAIGIVLGFLGFMFIGPSPLFSHMEKSIGLLNGAMVMTGLGVGLTLVLQPVISLRLLWMEARMTKADVAGSLAASQLICAMVGMIIAPILGSAMVDAIGFPWTTTILALVVMVVLIPVMWLLLKYSEPPTRGPWAKKPEPGTLGAAPAAEDTKSDSTEESKEL